MHALMYQFGYIVLAKRAQPLKPTGKSSRDLYIMRRRIKARNRWNRWEDATRKRERGQKKSTHIRMPCTHIVCLAMPNPVSIARSDAIFSQNAGFYPVHACLHKYACVKVCMCVYVVEAQKRNKKKIRPQPVFLLPVHYHHCTDYCHPPPPRHYIIVHCAP